MEGSLWFEPVKQKLQIKDLRTTISKGMLIESNMARIALKRSMLKHATKTSVRLLSKPRLHSLPSAIREALSHVRPNALVTLVLLARLSYGPASAATIHVNATCTLVDAITAANKDRATGGCTAGYQADTIMLPPNSIQMLIAVNNDINGLPPITTQN